MDIRHHEADLLSHKEHLEALEKSSIACTGVINGVVMACGGVSPFINGNAEIWLIPSVYLKSDSFLFARNLRRWLFGVREDLALIRMQTACIDDELHCNWMKFLGFEKEGIMKKYHNGKDYIMWGRVWE
jgi:hypothetical protein